MSLEFSSCEGLLWIAVLCALQVRQKNFLPVSPSYSLAHAAGTGHVQHLLLGVGEGGHGLLYVAQLDLVPLFLYRSTVVLLFFLRGKVEQRSQFKVVRRGKPANPNIGTTLWTGAGRGVRDRAVPHTGDHDPPRQRRARDVERDRCQQRGPASLKN